MSKILVVDDQELVAKSICVYLQCCGYDKTQYLTDSRDVISHLSKHPVDVIFLDLNMPYISGKDLIQPITDLLPQTTIIIISAIDDRSSLNQCLDAGAKDFLSKPIEPKSLLKYI